MFFRSISNLTVNMWHSWPCPIYKRVGIIADKKPKNKKFYQFSLYFIIRLARYTQKCKLVTLPPPLCHDRMEIYFGLETGTFKPIFDVGPRKRWSIRRLQNCSKKLLILQSKQQKEELFLLSMEGPVYKWPNITILWTIWLNIYNSLSSI